MKTLHDYFPWLTDEQVEKLRRKLLVRTAEDFEKGECWREAAECWERLGEVTRAAGLYGKVGDWQAAGKVLLLAKQYEAAREVYERWEEEAGEHGLLRVEALLGQAACEIMANEEEWVVPDSYREARALVEGGLGRPSTGSGTDGVTNALGDALSLRCAEPAEVAKGWAAIAAHGALVGRFDLLHMGYERALSGLIDVGPSAGSGHGDYAQRIAIGDAYLAAAKQYDDRLLVESIEERLAKWQIMAQEPPWMRFKQQIEQYPFRDGVRNVLHFTDEAQLEAWRELASMDPSASSGHREKPEVDDYLRTLAPPDMVYIPAGAFLMGWTEEEVQEILAEGEASGEIESYQRYRIEDAQPQHEVWLSGYYMSRYPITNAQYAAFMKDGGYQQAEYWREAAALGWWQDGKYQGRYDSNGRSQPRYWHNTGRNQPQQPVVGISWHEALAYCRWAGMDLPTEAQWEKAAGWDADEKRMRRYPWGDEYDESKVQPMRRKHSEVGQFCNGELNFYGLSDMTGLWQWCRSRYQPYPSTSSGTPYQLNEQREGLDGRDRRVIRGGRDYSLSFMRCRSRVGNYPDYNRYNNGGFRPVWPHALVLNSEF